jgi:hypothetical protein
MSDHPNDASYAEFLVKMDAAKTTGSKTVIKLTMKNSVHVLGQVEPQCRVHAR